MHAKKEWLEEQGWEPVRDFRRKPRRFRVVKGCADSRLPVRRDHELRVEGPDQLVFRWNHREVLYISTISSI
jgi:hypothetical protein